MSYSGGYGAPPPSGGYGAGHQASQGYGVGGGAPAGTGHVPAGYGQGPPPAAPAGGYGRAPGGFQGGGPPPPPPGADPQLWQWFSAVDSDRSGHISAPELQQALVNGDWTPFDLDTIKLLMTIFDTDRSGTIGFNEFTGLWRYIKDWQNVFRHFDADRSGSIDGQELANALKQFGYNLSPALLTLVEKKYDIKAGASAAVPAPARPAYGQPPPGITFDRFVGACVVVKQVTEAFQKLDTDRDGWVQINYDTFMQTVLHLP